MITTASAETATTATSVGALKKFATAAAMLGALGLGALGAAGAAAAAPAHHPAPKTSESSVNAGPKKGDDVVHAHFIPGFKPSPPPAGVQDSKMPAPFVPGYPIDPPLGASNSGRTLGELPPLPGYDPNHKDCGACEEVIDE